MSLCSEFISAFSLNTRSEPHKTASIPLWN